MINIPTLILIDSLQNGLEITDFDPDLSLTERFYKFTGYRKVSLQGSFSQGSNHLHDLPPPIIPKHQQYTQSSPPCITCKVIGA